MTAPIRGEGLFQTRRLAEAQQLPDRQTGYRQNWDTTIREGSRPMRPRAVFRIATMILSRFIGAIK